MQKRSTSRQGDALLACAVRAAMAAAVLAATAACTDTAPSRVLQPAAAPLADRAGNRTDRDETREIHGKREKLGDGSARTYVILGGERKQVPIEIGVVLDKRALEGLPTSAPGGRARTACSPTPRPGRPSSSPSSSASPRPAPP